MSDRLPRLLPEQLDLAQRALYDELTGGPRAAGRQLFPLADPQGRLSGPFDAMLRNPPVGEALQALGTRLRYRGQLSDRARELVILAVAAHWSSAFEAAAHERVALAVGVPAEVVEAVRDGRRTDLDDPTAAAALDAARALLDRSDLTDQEFARVSRVLSEGDLFEVICLVGYYGTLALTMRAFRADHTLDP